MRKRAKISTGNDGTQSRPADRAARARGITTRSVLLGFVLSVAHTCWIVYEETALGHLGVAFTSFMLLQSVVGLMFVLVLANSVLKRTVARWMLSPAEMMVVFSMATVSAIMAGFDLLQNLFPVLLWPYYFGASSDGFDGFFRYVPRWFVPQDVAVIREFFVGSREFWRFLHPEVFGQWLVPMAFWGGFLLLLAWTMLCLNSVLRRQWLDRERVAFPIIELPLMMARENTAGPLLRNPLLLAGFGLTAALLSMNCLSGLYPSVPGVRLNVVNIGRTAFATPPLSGMNPVYAAWWPYAIGLCYLIPLDISFSCWFSYVFIRLAAAFGTAQGWREPNAGFAPDQFPYFQNLAYGAWIGLFVVVMWSARGHLARVVRVALGREKPADDSREPLPYRVAFFGALAGFSALLTITTRCGMRPHIALGFLAIYFLATVVMTRIYAQVAVPLFELAFLSTGPLMTSFTGTSAFTRQDATILTHFFWFNRTYRQHPMGHELESFAFAERVGQRTRPMVWIVLLAAASGIAIGLLTTLQIYYERGAASAKVNPAQMGVGWESWNMLQSWTRSPGPPQALPLGVIGASAGIVFALAMARNAWFAFPIHPIGYAFACSYAMEYIWAVVLVTWFVKILVVRYGGLRLYRRSLPFFYGIVLGDAVTQLAWGVVMSALRAQGASPYLDMRW